MCVFKYICGAAAVVNSLPAHITVCSVFIYSCDVAPNDAPLAFGHHGVSGETSGQAAAGVQCTTGQQQSGGAKRLLVVRI